MAIHAIVWDVGGVLLRTADFAPRDALARAHGLTPLQLDHMVFGKDDAFRAQLGQVSYAQHWANLAARLGMDEEGIAAFRDAFFATDGLDEDLIESIRELRSQGYCTAVLSNYWDALRMQITDEWQIDDAFQRLIISSEVGLMKPDSAIYDLLLESIGFTTEETVFIDDSLENVRAAQQLGIHGVPFFVFDDKYAVSGAQPTTLFLDVLNNVWIESHPEEAKAETQS